MDCILTLYVYHIDQSNLFSSETTSNKRPISSPRGQRDSETPGIDKGDGKRGSHICHAGELVSQWVSESVIQWVSEWISVSVSQWVSELVSQWVSELVSQRVSESVSQRVSESVS